MGAFGPLLSTFLFFACPLPADLGGFLLSDDFVVGLAFVGLPFLPFLPVQAARRAISTAFTPV
jgi:hypothetical protein